MLKIGISQNIICDNMVGFSRSGHILLIKHRNIQETKLQSV